MLPVYVINLHRRPDRRATMSEHLERRGIEPKWVSAIDGRTLASQDYWEEHTNDNRRRRVMGYGDEGCTLSHYLAFRRLLDSDHRAALILEDDVELAPDAAGLLDTDSWWPDGFGLIKIEHNFPRTRGILLGKNRGHTPGGRQLRDLPRWNGGAGAYLIDRVAAQRVLDEAPEPPMPIDHLLFGLVDSPTARRLRPLQIQPAMARQRLADFESDTAPTRFPRDGWKADRKTLRGRLRRLPFHLGVYARRLKGDIRRERVRYSETPD